MGAYTKAGWPPAAALVFGAGRAGASEEDATRFAGGGCADAAAGCAERFKVSRRWRWSRTFCTLTRGLLAPLESSSLNDVFFLDMVAERERERERERSACERIIGYCGRTRCLVR